MPSARTAVVVYMLCVFPFVFVVILTACGRGAASLFYGPIGWSMRTSRRSRHDDRYCLMCLFLFFRGRTWFWRCSRFFALFMFCKFVCHLLNLFFGAPSRFLLVCDR